MDIILDSDWNGSGDDSSGSEFQPLDDGSDSDSESEERSVIVAANRRRRRPDSESDNASIHSNESIESTIYVGGRSENNTDEREAASFQATFDDAMEGVEQPISEALKDPLQQIIEEIKKIYHADELTEERVKLLKENESYLCSPDFNIETYRSIDSLEDKEIQRFINCIEKSNQEDAKVWKECFKAAEERGEARNDYVKARCAWEALFDHLNTKNIDQKTINSSKRRAILGLRVEEVRAVSSLITDKVIEDDSIAHKMVARYSETAKLLIRAFEKWGEEKRLSVDSVVTAIKKVLLRINTLEKAKKSATKDGKAHLNKDQLRVIKMLIIAPLEFASKGGMLSVMNLDALNILTENIELIVIRISEVIRKIIDSDPSQDSVGEQDSAAQSVEKEILSVYACFLAGQHKPKKLSSKEKESIDQKIDESIKNAAKFLNLDTSDPERQSETESVSAGDGREEHFGPLRESGMRLYCNIRI